MQIYLSIFLKLINNITKKYLLKYCLLEKAIYELGYELNSRPKWTVIPLKGIANILNT
jgi:maltose alpha-D-glucosyltransferase/alpha-amylase